MNVESGGLCNTATKQRIQDIIEDSIDIVSLKRHFVTLNEVNSLIARAFQKNLGEYDRLYIENKYIEILVKRWIIEDCSFVVEIIDPYHILNLIEELTSIESFSHCLKIIEGFNPIYTKLLLQESHTSERLKTQEKLLAGKFKCESLNLVLLSTDWIRDELQFLWSFSEAINYTRDLAKFWQAIDAKQFVDASSQQQEQHSALQHLLSKLQSCSLACSKVSVLKQAARNLVTNQKYFFVTKLREIIIEYMKPVEITASIIDGRSVLEVSGKHIVFSKELEILQTHPQFVDIEEVRFIRAEAIHINSDLNSSYWHGKNIVVYCELLIVQEDDIVTWDVSGKNANATCNIMPAGTSSDGIGKEGGSGGEGESGGNVLVIASTIVNAQYLRVVSNGGNGSKGQTGGRGADGSDGHYIDQQSFKTLFPPVSKFIDNSKKENLNITKNSILQSLRSVTSFRLGCSDDLVDNSSTQMTKDFFNQHFSKCITDLTSFYIEVDSDNGCKILFSFYGGGFLSPCQSFLLHKGEFGHEGQPGGVGGPGGSGGFPGEIEVVDDLNSTIQLIANYGMTGNQGESGAHGKSGKNGLDIAYLDYSTDLFGNWPKFYILNSKDNKQLEPRYSCESSSENVYCAHNNMYATMSTVGYQVGCMLQTHQLVRLTSTLKQTQQHTVKVTRKKSNNKDSIKERYKQTSSFSKLFKLDEYIDKAKALLDIEETLELEQVTTESKVVKLKNFSSASYLSEEQSVMPYCTSEKDKEKKQHSVEQLIERLKRNPYDGHLWLILQKQSLNTMEVRELWDLVPAEMQFTQVVYTELCHKYQIALLKWLANESSNFLLDESRPVFHNEFFKTDNMSNLNRLLVIDKSNKAYSPLEKCFCEDSVNKRKEIVRRLCEDNQLLRKLLGAFLTEFSNSKEDSSIFAQVEKRYSIYKKKTNNEVRIKFMPLKKVLDRANHQHMYSLLFEGLVQQSTTAKINFENEIAKDKFLKHLYFLYVNSTKIYFDWNIPEAEVFKDFCFETIYNEGPHASCYRELLALLFKTNIFFYSTNESEEIFLLENHNTNANSTVHILKKGERYFRLNVDKNYESMLKQHKTQSEFYSKVLFHVDSLIEKGQFDNFISESPFKSNHYNGVDKSTRINIRIKQLLRQADDLNTIFYELESLHLTEYDMSLIRNRVEKLKFEFSGCEDILYYMALHFHSEGILISVKELSFIINCILKAAGEGKTMLSLASWIIASQLQTQWLAELTLLQLELFFKRPLATQQNEQWRSYLQSFKEKETLMLFLERISGDICTVSMECIENTLHLLSRIPKAYIGLDKLDLEEWKYYLKDRFWAQEIYNITNWTQEELVKASYFLVVLENVVGSDMCSKLVGIVRNHQSEIDCEEVKHVIFYTLRMMTNQETNISDKLIEQLSSSNILNWQKIIEDRYLISGNERSLPQLVELIRNSNNTSPNIASKLDDSVITINYCDNLVNKLKQYLNNKDQLSEWISRLLKATEENLNKENKNEENNFSFRDEVQSFLRTFDGEIFENTLRSIFSVIFNSSSLDSDSTEPTFFKSLLKEEHDYILFATVITAIDIIFKIKLRPTQKLAIMTMLNSSKNVLGQVATGEGKSFIVVAVAIMKALLGHKVDIITSSRVLAKRDAKEYQEIYSLFGINVGHNCSEDLEERKKEYSNKHVVYGELSNFQRDFLLDRFYNKNVLGDRNFETILVDEVDSMLLDKGNNILYLSHDIPGLDRLHPLFLYIWKLLNLSLNKNTQIDITSVKESILYDLFGVITQEDIKNLDRTLSNSQINNTWEGLIKLKIINNAGHVIKNEFNDNCLDLLYTKADNCLVNKNHLNYLLKKVLERQIPVEIPNHLKEFVELHLEEWLESAMRAMCMESGVDYVLDVDRSIGVGGDIGRERGPNVILMDRDTGTDLINSQWDGGLHQFLQIKHGCRLSPLSLKAVFVSNVKYFNNYKTLYGLTGTLGSQRERQLLTDIYSVDYVTIPTAKPKCFHEKIPILCSSTEQWLIMISNEVYEETLHRSVLVVCETVNDVMTFHRMFSKDKFSNRRVYTYKRDYEQFDVAAYLKPGCIIISTNLAGRGTDIKLSKELIYAGGLHICLTFLPSNSRVEEQAFGRAARNGEPGSARIIFYKDNKKGTAARVIDLKKQRDVEELLRVMDIKRYYESRIQLEEKCFQQFSNTYSKLLNKSTHSEEIKLVLLHTALNEWALYLDKHSRHFTTESISQINKFLKNIKKLGEHEIETWSNQVKDPNQLIKLGVLFIGRREYKIASNLFQRVIEEEPNCSEVARYYTLLTKTALNDCKPEDLINQLKCLEKQLKKRIQSTMMSAHLIDWLKERSPSNILQIESFKEQQHNISNTYEIFLHSIYNFVGNNISPKLFAAQLNIDDHLADILFNDLLAEGIIIGPRLRVEPPVKEKELNFSANYGMPPKILSGILNKYSDYENILKELKKKLPSRESFWNELLLKNILTNEVKYCFVDVEKLCVLDPSLNDVLKNLKQDTPPEDPLWLYRVDEIRILQPQQQLVFKTSTVLNVMKLLYSIRDEAAKQRLKFLKRKKIVTFNKHASITEDPTEEIPFNQFNYLSVDDFVKMGIAKDVALNVIAELQEKNMIKYSHSLTDKKMYTLLIKGEDIGNIELTTHNKYSNDVQNVLATCFAFRIALKNFVYGSANGELCLYLPVKLHRQIVSELQTRGILEDPIVNPDKNIIINDILKKLYSTAKTEQEICKLLKQVYDSDNIIKNFFTELVYQNYLKKDDSFKIKDLNYIFDINKKPVFYSITLPLNSNNAISQPLSELLQDNIKSIVKMLSDHKKLAELVADEENPIHNMLMGSRGEIHRLNTPIFSLQPLLTIMENSNQPMTEYGTFSLNGFDQVLVLTEKKYTKRVICIILCSFILGVTEIIAGYLLKVINPLFASRLVLEGFNDITATVNYVFSGYCSYEDLCLNKILNLGINLLTLIPIISKSNNLFLRLFTKPTPVRPQVSVIVKRVMLCTAEAVGRGLTYATFDHLIQPHCERVAAVIIDKIAYTDIDQTLKAHSVTKCIEELIQKLGHRAPVTIKHCLEKAIDVYTNKCSTCWNRNVGLLRTLVNKHILKEILQEKKTNKEIGSSIIEWIGSITIAFSTLQKAIDSSKTLYVSLTTMTSDILNKLEEILKNKLRQISQNPLGVVISPEETTSLAQQIQKDIERSIKDIVVDQVNEKVIRPVLHYAQHNLIAYSNKCIVKKYSSFFSKQESETLSKLRKNIKPISKNKDNVQTFVDIQHEKYLLDLLKKRRSAALYIDLLKKKAPMDYSCMELCCSIVPQALRRAGIYVPKLRLVVQRNGVTREFSTGRGTDCLTVYFNQDGDFTNNIQSNEPLIRNVCQSIYNTILQNNPQYKGTADILHQMVTQVIDNDINYIQEFINIFFKRECNSSYDQFMEKNNELNVAAEKENPYEHFLPEEEWIFNPRVDMDLRTKFKREKLFNFKPLNQILIEGYKAALNKINNHIADPQYGLHLPFSLVLEDFEKTYEIGPQIDKRTGSNFDCYVSRYELVLPLLIHINEGQEEVEFQVMMTLKRLVESNPHSPRGPHILYELNPCSALHHFAKKVHGHILLDPECRLNTHLVSNCQSVGELILPTCVKRVLILGDSMFTHLSNYVNQVDCVTQCFNDDKPKVLKNEISTVIRQYPNIKCVVLYFGMFVLKYQMSADKVANELNQVISLIRSQLKNVNIIMCSIALRKQISTNSANRKQLKIICRTINYLRSYFSEKNVTFWETNTYLRLEDLSEDGVHLNEEGYRKMAKYISRIATKNMSLA